MVKELLGALRFSTLVKRFFAIDHFRYAMIQTYENAERRTRELVIYFDKLFDGVAGIKNAEEVDVASLKIVLTKELEYMNE